MTTTTKKEFQLRARKLSKFMILSGIFFFTFSASAISFFNRLLGKGVSTVTVEAVYPTNGGNWNDYVKRTSNGVSDNDYNQPDITCAGNETGRYEACIHGGEKRKATVTGYTSCSNITATDSLNAFDWECSLTGGVATVYSIGLKSSAGLGDLVNASSWKQNSINVYQGGNLIARSNAANWYTNTVMAPPSNPLNSDASVTLTTASVIYVVTANTTTSGYLLQADKVGFVVKSGAKLSWSGRTTKNYDLWAGGIAGTAHFSILGAGAGGTNPGRRFLWIEGSYDASAYPSNYEGFVIAAYGVRFSVYRNLILKAASGGLDANGGMGIIYSYSDLIKNLVIDNSRSCWPGIMEAINSYMRWHTISVNDLSSTSCNGAGFDIDGSYSAYTDIKIQGANGVGGAPDWAARGIRANSSFSQSTVTGVLVSGAGDLGFASYTSTRSTLHQFTSVNNLTMGIVSQQSTYMTMNSVVAANNGKVGGGGGILLQQSANNNLLSQLVLTNNTLGFSTGLAADTTSTGGVLVNNILIGNNDNDCTGDNPTAGFTSACANQGGSTAVWRMGKSIANSLVGKVTSNDSTNQSDTNGQASFAAIADWAGFDSWFRMWGKDGSAFPASDNRGPCSSGTCRIWDFRVRLTDTIIRNTSNDGNSQNASFISGAACPAAVDGNYALTDQKSSPQTFLVNAREVVGDYANGKMIGNDDGLCETGETCIYAPNFGAYQGEGNYAASGPCLFSNGTVSNVVMYAYPTNGN